MVVFLTLVLLMLASAFALLWAIRGRQIDDHRVCRRCKFDLFGLPVLHATCPECGSKLSGVHAIQLGNRKRNPALLYAFSAATLLFFAATTTIYVGSARNVNWSEYKPYWMLKDEAQSSEWFVAQPALNILEARRLAGKLSTDQANEFIALALATQADPSKPWHPIWADVIEQNQSKLSKEQFASYLRHIVRPTLDVRPNVTQGDFLPAMMPIEWRCSDRVPYTVQLEALSHQLGEQQFPTNDLICGGEARKMHFQAHAPIQVLGRSPHVDLGIPRPFWFEMDTPVTVKPGVHTFTTTWRVTVRDKVPRMSHIFVDDGERGRQVKQYLSTQPSLASYDFTLTQQVRVLPAGTSSVTLVNDPQIIQQVSASFSAQSYASGGVHLKFAAVPVGLAFDVTLQQGERTERSTVIIPAQRPRSSVQTRGGRTENHAFRNMRNDLPLVITLTPNPKLAACTPDLEQIYGGTITHTLPPLSPPSDPSQRQAP